MEASNKRKAVSLISTSLLGMLGHKSTNFNALWVDEALRYTGESYGTRTMPHNAVFGAAGRPTFSAAQAKRNKQHRKGVRLHKQRVKS